jgi:hypothetical protein
MNTSMKKQTNISAILATAMAAMTVSGSAATLWTPADVTASAWWDASDTATITAAGTVISQWNDKSGNGIHATTISATNRPLTGGRTIGGLNAVEFQGGINDGLQFANINMIGNEMWAVFVQDAAADVTIIGAGGNSQLTVLSSGKMRSWQNGSGYSPTDGQSNETVTQGQATVGGWLQHTTSQRKFSLDGTLSDNKGTWGGSGTHNGSRIGTQQYAQADGLIGEIVITSGELSLDDRARMEGYLAWKWGTQASLPTGHTYELAAPTVIPEPAAVGLFGLTGLGLILRRRRK